MSVFDEKSEKALEEALEHPDVQTELKELFKVMLPYVAEIISKATEIKKDGENKAD